jgi:hypothetical protein
MSENQGTCLLFNTKHSKRAMTSHVKLCSGKNTVSLSESNTIRAKTFHIVVEGTSPQSPYWLHLEVPGKSTL